MVVWEIENHATGKHEYVTAESHDSMKKILLEKGFAPMWDCPIEASNDCLVGRNSAGNEISAMPEIFRQAINIPNIKDIP